MWDFLAGWKPGEVIGLFAVLGGLLTAVAVVGTIVWSIVRHAEIKANLKRDLVQRGFTVEQIERLVYGPSEASQPVNEKELEAQLASLLVQHEVEGPVMDRVLRLYQATDPGTKRAVYDSIEEILDSDASEEQLLTAVRALCPPRSGTPAPLRLDEMRVGV
jgi:hypothetical protein